MTNLGEGVYDMDIPCTYYPENTETSPYGLCIYIRDEANTREGGTTVYNINYWVPVQIHETGTRSKFWAIFAKSLP